MTLKEQALMLAEKVHRHQEYGPFPYMYHINKVKGVAEKLGYDEEIVISCILHDCLEDTSLSYSKIRNLFSKEIADIVYAVTDELGKTRGERKRKTYPKIRKNWKAVVVKICDRIANMEFSYQSKSSHYSMYDKEYGLFKEELFNSEHPKDVMKAWDAYDNILKF